MYLLINKIPKLNIDKQLNNIKFIKLTLNTKILEYNNIFK